MKLRFARKAHLVVTSLALLLITSCTSKKTLTPSSARDMIQTHVDDTNSGAYEINYADVARLIGTTYEDYKAAVYGPGPQSVFQGLLKSGLVSQSVETILLPDLSGMYEGTVVWGRVGGGRVLESKLTPVTLSMQQGSAAVSGSMVILRPDPPDWVLGCKGTFNGQVTAKETANLMFKVTENARGCVDPDETSYKIKRDGNIIELSNEHVTLRGGSASGEIRVPRYTYIFAPAFSQLIIQPGRTINGGHLLVDSVDQLMLGPTGDTTAGGRMRWHVTLNEAGKILTGKTSITGEGFANFGKQPNGEWVFIP